MGTPLTGTSVSSSYAGLIKIGDNSSISTTIKQLSTGAGHDLNIWLGENYTEFRQFLNISPAMAGGPANLTFRSYSASSPGTILGTLNISPLGASTKMFLSTEVDSIQIEVGGTATISNGELTKKVVVFAAGLQLITNQSLPTLGTSESGLLFFDSNSKKFRGWTGTAWVDFH